MATDAQPALIPGHYRCDDCGRTVERVRPTRRFRLCDGCYERVVPRLAPDVRVRAGSPEAAAIRRYWEWYDGMEKRVPPRRVYTPPARPKPRPVETDDYYPLCACGGRREAYSFSPRPRGLFGGPFQRECPVCEARRQVEATARLTHHPEWDDEDWLDFLYRVFPRAFEVGVLPDYWYELRRGG